MIPYWLLFLALAFGALLHQPRVAMGPSGPVVVRSTFRNNPGLGLAAAAIILMIGFRYEVGGDWRPYLATFDSISSSPFLAAIEKSPAEFGYTTINWVAGQLGAGIWLVNLLCAIPLLLGLLALGRRELNPFLLLAIATPSVIVIVGMGYTRQAAALGFLMLGLADLLDERPFHRFLVWTTVGATFHVSVLFLVPIVAVLTLSGSIWSLLISVVATAVAIVYVVPFLIDRYSVGYIKAVYEAQGALFRVGLNVAAAIVFLIFRERLVASRLESKLWTGWAAFALASLVALFNLQSTVIVDRLSVYLLPLQLFVFTRLAYALAGQRSAKQWILAILFFPAGTLFVWLNFAENARFWIPYRSFLLL